jgi:hypothetical protein
MKTTRLVVLLFLIAFAAGTCLKHRCLGAMGGIYIKTDTQTDGKDLRSAPLRWVQVPWCALLSIKASMKCCFCVPAYVPTMCHHMQRTIVLQRWFPTEWKNYYFIILLTSVTFNKQGTSSGNLKISCATCSIKFTKYGEIIYCYYYKDWFRHWNLRKGTQTQRMHGDPQAYLHFFQNEENRLNRDTVENFINRS